MKSKSLIATFVLGLVMALTFATSATPQVKIDLGKQVKLPCQVLSGGDVASNLQVTNNSGATVPADTLIFFSTNIGNLKWRITEPIAKNATKRFDGPAGDPASCQAWYFK